MFFFSTWITYFLVIFFIFLGTFFKGGHDLFHELFDYIHFDCKDFIYFDLDTKKSILDRRKTIDILNIHYRIYDNKNYGSYCYSIYVVRPGDTLYYIAWLTGNNYLDLAKYNQIDDLNYLRVGQILKINNNSQFLWNLKYKKNFYLIFDQCSNLIKNIFFFIKNKMCFVYNKKNIFFSNIREKVDKHRHIELSSTSVILGSWNWPTYGKIINNFSDSERGNAGVDISGILGQPIVAAANGTVIYVSNKLKGYGNLVIIKHDGDYLSAYAHNDTVLVKEQQIVQAGDKIATMGRTGTNEVKLHFEIRYKGKSINPLYFYSCK